MDLVSIILAFAAGIVGTTIGGVQAFVWCGFVGLAGMGVDAALGGMPFIAAVPFGFWFHPAMAFLGGVGAAAYARKMGYIESAKDGTATALSGLRKPDVLLIGGPTARRLGRHDAPHRAGFPRAEGRRRRRGHLPAFSDHQGPLADGGNILGTVPMR